MSDDHRMRQHNADQCKMFAVSKGPVDANMTHEEEPVVLCPI